MTEPVSAAEPTAAPVASFKMGNLGRHSLVYGVGIMLTKVVSFVMLPIYTRFLTPSDYGILQLVMMILEIASIFAGSRIAFGIFHYYHKATDESGRKDVLSTALLLLTATYAMAAAGAIIFAPQIANAVFGEDGQYATYVRLAAAGMAFEGLIVVPTALYQLRDRSKQFVLVSLLRVVLQLILNVVFLVMFGMGVTGVLLAALISNLVVGVVLALQVLNEVGFRFRFAEAREFLRFGLPLVAMQVATFAFTFGDRYFLNRAADVAAVGLYGLAYQFGFLVATVGFAPFQRVWDPQRFAVAKRPDRDAIYARVFVYLNLGLISAALGISLFSGDVLRIIAAPGFQGAGVYVPVIVVAYVFHCWGNFINIGIYVRERTEYFTAANWAAAFVAIAGYMLLIPRWFAWGAAVATLLAMIVRFWLSYYFSQRLWPVRYEWKPVVWLGIVALAFGAVPSLMRKLPLPLSLATHAALFALYVVVVWRLILSDEDRAAVTRFVRSRTVARASPVA